MMVLCAAVGICLAMPRYIGANDTLSLMPNGVEIAYSYVPTPDGHMPHKAVASMDKRICPPRVPVILANYQNATFKPDNISGYEDYFNGDNYTYEGATGSVRKYFADQSTGAYQPSFDIFGPVTLSHNYAYYGQDSYYEGYDIKPAEMIAEACRLVDQQTDINFANYDSDHDGYVDAVYVVYAGYGQADGGDANTVWPHSAEISNRSSGATVPVLDGVRVDNYTTSPELESASGKSLRQSIGVACHEFTHGMGFPDLYASGNHKTLGKWDPMDYGIYNNSGKTPPNFSAYERFFFGWLTPTLVQSHGEYTLSPLGTSNEALIITKDGRHNMDGYSPDPVVFYILENRQQSGWDRYLPGNGMLLTKIQYSQSKWRYNMVNQTSTAQGVDIREADGVAPSRGTSDFLGKATDAFPAGATSYTDNTIANYPITNVEQKSNKEIVVTIGGHTDIHDTPAAETILRIYDIHGRSYTPDRLLHLPQGAYIIQTDQRTYRTILP